MQLLANQAITHPLMQPGMLPELEVYPFKKYTALCRIVKALQQGGKKDSYAYLGWQSDLTQRALNTKGKAKKGVGI